MLAGLDRALDRHPLRPPVVRGLDADHVLTVFLRRLGSGPCIHVVDVLLVFVASLAMAHDVEHRQDARLNIAALGTHLVDQISLEFRKVAPAGRARVHGGSYAAAKSMAVGVYVLLDRQAAAQSAANNNMRVQIDESGGNVEPRDTDNFPGFARRDVFRHAGDLASGDANIENLVDFVLRIDQMAALEHQVIGLLRGQAKSRETPNRNREEISHLVLPSAL